MVALQLAFSTSSTFLSTEDLINGATCSTETDGSAQSGLRRRITTGGALDWFVEVSIAMPPDDFLLLSVTGFDPPTFPERGGSFDDLLSDCCRIICCMILSLDIRREISEAVGLLLPFTFVVDEGAVLVDVYVLEAFVFVFVVQEDVTSVEKGASFLKEGMPAKPNAS